MSFNKKIYRSVVCIMAIALMANCDFLIDSFDVANESDFNSFDYKPFEFVFGQPDISPGQVVEFFGLYPGVQYYDNLKCYIAFDVRHNDYGEEFISDRRCIEEFLMPESDYSIGHYTRDFIEYEIIKEVDSSQEVLENLDENCSSGEFKVKDELISFRFKIPKDVIRNSKAVNFSHSNEFINFIEDSVISSDNLLRATNLDYDDDVRQALALLFQLTTIEMYFIVEQGEYSVYKKFSVRYNSAAINSSLFSVVRNPTLTVSLVGVEKGSEFSLSRPYRRLQSWQPDYIDYVEHLKTPYEIEVEKNSNIDYYLIASSTMQKVANIEYCENKLNSILNEIVQEGVSFRNIGKIADADLSFDFFYDNVIYKWHHETPNENGLSKSNLLLKTNYDDIMKINQEVIPLSDTAEIWLGCRTTHTFERKRPIATSALKVHLIFE